VFAINDPTAIGAELAAKQLNRSEFFFTAVDGAPDIEKSLSSGKSMIKASASQDPYTMAGDSLKLAVWTAQRQEAGTGHGSSRSEADHCRKHQGLQGLDRSSLRTPPGWPAVVLVARRVMTQQLKLQELSSHVQNRRSFLRLERRLFEGRAGECAQQDA
jgi:ABC-type sugar transport system substrate-binding protein